MRKYVWYSPELDEIVIQIVSDDCVICFEWSHLALCHLGLIGVRSPMQEYLWMPLGEL